MAAIKFRCRAKTDDAFRVITVDPGLKAASCDCDGFDGFFCAHIDATLLAGERFMVPDEDRNLADRAMAIVLGRIPIPFDWKASWRKNNVWRGLSAPRGPRQRADMKDAFGDDYYSRPKVCFTGTGPCSRKDLLQQARDAGWQAVEKFQSEIKLLVAEDPTRNTSKLMQARKLAIPVLSYEEWSELSADGVFE